MNYLYYPGCSLEGSAVEYDVSTREFFAALEIKLTDIEGWNCCGATAAAPVSELLSIALPARNLALAERMDTPGDILAPCSACYLNLKRAAMEKSTQSELSASVDEVLSAEGLALEGSRSVRHLLDVLVNDVGPDRIKEKVTCSLEGLKIAPYYGCQCLRPYVVFDDPEAPVSMEGFIRATGADVFAWESGARCCGASGMNTKREVARELVIKILRDARGADAIVTVCPMCQMNLEAFQKSLGRECREDLSISVIYLPQLLGMSMGIAGDTLMLDKNLALKNDFMERVYG